MSKKSKSMFAKLSRAELIRRLEAIESLHKDDKELHAMLHDLHVYQEEVRVQNEQLLEVKRSLEQSRDRYADLYDFAPIAYVTLSAEGLVQEMNLTGAILLGSERSRIIDTPLITYVHDKDRSLFLDHMRRCRSGEAQSAEGVRTEMRLMSRKKILSPVQLFSRSSPTSGGGPPVFSTAITDLTELKTTEEEKRQLILSEQSARAAAEAKDEFLAVVSHELRTPLTAILLWAKLLRSGHVSPNQTEVALGAIEHSASAQQQLIEDLLDISRLVSGRLRLEIRETDIVPVIQGALETVRPAAELKGVHLEYDLPARLGNIRIDPDRVRQVVWNLVHNGIKFTPAGGHVALRLHRIRDSLRIEVKDTGQGIPRSFLPHIFERFRQADSGPTRTFGGLGLGLAIARQLVELHGGTISVQSAGEGKGATFTVELPAAALPARQRKGSDAAARSSGKFVAAPVLQNVRILLIEDDKHTRDAIRWLLEQCSATVVGVDSVAGALNEFQKGLKSYAPDSSARIDLLISDIAMPDEDGYHLIRQVRKLERAAGIPPVPAIAITAFVRERHRADALTAGFGEYMPKPIDPDALIAAALRLLQQKEEKSIQPPAPNAPAFPGK
jgi:PAS domain S-box-containing protein